MKAILFFDGVCGLCNHSVLFVLARDTNKIFHYSPLQSPFALDILPTYGGDPAALNTVYVLKNPFSEQPELLQKSSAACYVLSELGGLWSIFALGRFLPRFFRDFLYDCVAKTRYSLFGKKEVCMLPEEDWMERFIEDIPS